jgi:xanthine dehydrogenase molybdopterin-binding subunit B
MPGVVKFLQAKDIPGTNNYYVFGAHQDEVCDEI